MVGRNLVAVGNGRQLVLVIEDEPMLMLSSVQLFEGFGFDALVAFTTDEAMGHLEGRNDIVAIFCEHDAAGGLDGPGLSQVVRSRWPTIEIMLVSMPRVAGPPDLPLGARYFEKPYSRAQVERALTELGLIGAVPKARTNLPPKG
jgi:CheY-like chemotaxis protein